MAANRVKEGAVSRPVRDVPERLRPREEMARLGAQNVPDDVLLAIILRSGVRGMSVIDLARYLLARYGSLTALAKAPVDELSSIKGLGKVKPQVLMAALELGRRITQESQPRQASVRSPGEAACLLREEARTLDAEKFWILLLDAKNRLKGEPMVVTKGLLDASLVHPREVFREAIRTASAAVIVLHNHPSGDPTPSPEDVRITRQLVQAGRVIGIKVLDHIVLGKRSGVEENDFLSMRESGLVSFNDHEDSSDGSR